MHEWLRNAGRVLNSGEARTLLFTGNVHDLFRLERAGGEADYVVLSDLIAAAWSVPEKILLIYEINGPIRFVREADRETLRRAWLKWRTGMDENDLAIKRMLAPRKANFLPENIEQDFDANLKNAVGNPTLALELLRQFCLCSRTSVNGNALLSQNLILVVEAADLILPESEVAAMSDADRHRLCVCHDWFSDPGFASGNDSVVLVAESASMLHSRVARLPHLVEIEIPAPAEDARLAFISWFDGKLPARKLNLWSTKEDLARLTAGLSIQALRQLLRAAAHDDRQLSQNDVVSRIEVFIRGQLGDDIIEFKKPTHSLDEVIGFSRLKEFLRNEMMPRFRAGGDAALPGAAVCGPIGGGKTYIFEAVASELDMVVIVLKNIRSQWFGQTDVLFERLRRVLLALSNVLIFVDEADTQFGGVGLETHDTERRLTGKIQGMMSDSALRGKVVWLLMTARIHQLSPDIRRPGRVGDLIIPVLDPEDEDREAFMVWLLKAALQREPTEEERSSVSGALTDTSAATFAALRSELKAKASIKGGPLDISEIGAVIADHIPPAIGETRRYQTLQALVNCTRRQLLPTSVQDGNRSSWQAELRKLEAAGIR